MQDILNRLREPARETRAIDLGDYAEDYRGVVVHVWVTLTRAHVRRRLELGNTLNAANQRIQRMDESERSGAVDQAVAEFEAGMLEWFAATWLRLEVGSEMQDVTLPVAQEIRDLLTENAPNAWDWLCQRTYEVIAAYRDERLKN